MDLKTKQEARLHVPTTQHHTKRTTAAELSPSALASEWLERTSASSKLSCLQRHCSHKQELDTTRGASSKLRCRHPRCTGDKSSIRRRAHLWCNILTIVAAVRDRSWTRHEAHHLGYVVTIGTALGEKSCVRHDARIVKSTLSSSVLRTKSSAAKDDRTPVKTPPVALCVSVHASPIVNTTPSGAFRCQKTRDQQSSEAPPIS